MSSILFILLTQFITFAFENFELLPSPPIKHETIFFFLNNFENLLIESLDNFFFKTKVPVIWTIFLNLKDLHYHEKELLSHQIYS